MKINEQVKQTVLFSFVVIKNLYFIIELATDRFYNENNADVFLIMTGSLMIELGFVFYLMCNMISVKRFIYNCIITNTVFIGIGYACKCDLISLRFLFLNIMIFVLHEYLLYFFNILSSNLYKVSKNDFKYDMSSCSICLDDFDKNDCRNLSRFKCYHIYHKSCIESYQKVSNNVCCPLCRV
jgi:hypothetical protein